MAEVRQQLFLTGLDIEQRDYIDIELFLMGWI